MSKTATLILSLLTIASLVEGQFASWGRSPAVAIKPPKGEENLPPSEESAGGRNPESAIISLMPESGYAATGHPTFFVYVPQAQGKKAFFSLQDSDWNPHYSKTLEILENEALVAIALPKDLPGLEKNKDYRWNLTLFDKVMTPNSDRIAGVIRRLEPPATNRQMSAVELANFYAQNGFWYDALSILWQTGKLKIDQNWQELLASLGWQKSNRLLPPENRFQSTVQFHQAGNFPAKLEGDR